MKRLQAYWLAVAASVLAILISPCNLIGLPVGIWALVVLSQREVRAAFAASAVRPSERRFAKSRLHKLVIAVVVALLARIDRPNLLCRSLRRPRRLGLAGTAQRQPFSCLENDKDVRARDLIVYRFEGHNNVGRVVRNEGADLVVNRNGEPNAKVAREDVIGKVICVYWRASAATTEEPAKSTISVPETPSQGRPGAAPTAASPEKKTVPKTSAAAGGSKDEPLRTAQNERIQALQRAFDVVDAQYRNATATPEERMAALDAVLEAQLDAAKTKAERIASSRKTTAQSTRVRKDHAGSMPGRNVFRRRGTQGQGRVLGGRDPPSEGKGRRCGQSFARREPGSRRKHTEAARRADRRGRESARDS